ncbi:hypothetical protein I79_012941 [Cricetulus griseus]|uniref:Uncharacterized protein n=1 Tax=Cricetulus griseus TaxID=10029 RepID=G3HQ47_CRIGR|nr:hypothetical protein I79_012941 [Cricetulus griseus]
MKGKNLTARKGWSTIMRQQGSYRVGRKFLSLPMMCQTRVPTANSRDSRNCFPEDILTKS